MKRSLAKNDDTSGDLNQFYVDKLQKFGEWLSTFHQQSSVCIICYSMLNQYDGVQDYDLVKQKKRSSNINTAVMTTKEESAFEVKGCNHIFHLGCAKQIVQNQTSGTFFECPVCKTIQGIKTGNQPESGEMKISKEDFDLPGYKKGWTLKKNDDTNGQSGYKHIFAKAKGTIVVEYKFTDGIQDDKHPNPGQPYHAHIFPRKAYFPATLEGIKIVRLLRVAFDRRLVFTVGRSATTGKDNVIVWNGIHHKTKIADSNYGYPDPSYLQRVEEELKALGVIDTDLQQANNLVI